MTDLISFINKIDLKDFTLIFPSVSVGNVPQLTVDLIISSFKLHRTGILWHPAILPSVGGDPFEEQSSEVTTACELYANKDLKLAVIQLRSSIEASYAQSFFDLFLETIHNLQVKSLVILTSAFSHEMHDVKSSCFRYVSSNNEVISYPEVLDESILQCNLDELHGGTGFASKLYRMAMEKKIATFLLCKYTSEGDNRPDAIEMINVLLKLFSNLQIGKKNLIPGDLTFPMSWDHVFGNPPPRGIY